MATCVLSHGQVASWEVSGVRPPCQFHYHTSYTKARISVEQDEAIWIPELRAIVMFTCVARYVWLGRRSGGFSTLQLTAVIGRKSPLGLCAEARKHQA